MPEERPPLPQLPHIGIERHPHISIEREPDVEPERRRRAGYGTPAPRRQPAVHGASILHSVANAVSEIARGRQPFGVAPDRLIVVEFSSWDPACRNVFEERFGVSVVDERFVEAVGHETTRVLVQFDSLDAIARFTDEADRYRTEDTIAGEMPSGLRAAFFGNLERARAVSSEDRIGNRLRAEGFPDSERCSIDVDLWHPGSRDAAREVLQQLRQVCHRFGGAVTDDLRTSSLVLARVAASRTLLDHLLNFDIIAQVNLPPSLPAV